MFLIMSHQDTSCHIGVRTLCDISVFKAIETSFCVNCLADSQSFRNFAAVNQKM